MQMVNLAGESLFESYSETLAEIRDLMPSEDWDSVVVVVMDTQNARLDNLLAAVFLEFFGADIHASNRFFFVSYRDLHARTGPCTSEQLCLACSALVVLAISKLWLQFLLVLLRLEDEGHLINPSTDLMSILEQPS